MNNEIPSSIYAIHGYNLWRSDRNDCYGGIALYVNDQLHFKKIDLVLENNSKLEYLCGVVNINKEKYCICILYRPPTDPYGNIAPFLQSLFIDKSIEMDKTILLGDLNIDLSNQYSFDSKFLNRHLNSLNLTQLVNEPTRVTNTSCTLIDHIILHQDEEVSKVSVVDTSIITNHQGKKITDHKLIYCELPCQMKKYRKKYVQFRDYKNIDIPSFLNAAKSINWSEVLKLRDVDEIVKNLSSKILTMFDSFAPVTSKIFNKKKAPWRNEEVICLHQEKNRLKKHLKHNIHVRTAYCLARNKLNTAIRNAKKVYYSNKFTGCKDSKFFWKTLKDCGIAENINCKIPESLGTLNDINYHFSKVGNTIKVNEDYINYYSKNKSSKVRNQFQFKAVSSKMVIQAMNRILSMSTGSDGISIFMIKSLSPFCIEEITHLINMSLSSGVFPSLWKQSIIVPLPKNSKLSTLSDLRPISVLPTLSKILERIVVEQFVYFLEEENILPDNQSGFRKTFSTTTALVNLVDDLIRARDSHMFSLISCLDYNKAFDSVNHKLFISKLFFYNFDFNSINWFTSYLSDRKQLTKLNNIESSLLPVNSGVPQGSCLGPIMFILYTSDLAKCIKYCSLHSYADDTQLVLSYLPTSIECAIAQMNEDLERIKDWSEGHCFSINLDKSSVIHFDFTKYNKNVSSTKPNIVLGNLPLKTSKTTKILGLILDSNLNFNEHIKKVYRRAFVRLRMIYHMKYLLPETTKLHIVKSLILPILEYVLPAYGNGLSRYSVKLLTQIQNVSIRFVYNLQKFDHISEFRKTSKILNIEEITKLRTLCLVHKVLFTGNPLYLKTKLNYKKDIRKICNRQDLKLNVYSPNLEIGRRSFSYYGPKLYNEVDEKVKTCNYNQFKKKIREVISKRSVI